MVRSKTQIILKRNKDRQLRISKMREKLARRMEIYEAMAKELGVAWFEIQNAVDLIKEMRDEDIKESPHSES